MPDQSSQEPVSSTHQAHTLRSNEVTVLRETLKVYEIEANGTEMVMAQMRGVTDSRFYPLVLLFLKGTNFLELRLRRYLRRPAPSGPVTPPRVPARPEEPVAATGQDLTLPVEQEDESTTPVPPRYERALRHLLHALKVIVRGNSRRTSPRLEANPYYNWNAIYRQMNDGVRKHLRRRMELFTRDTRFSIVMATYNTRPAFLREAIESVLDQLYPHFELIIADDCSPHGEVRDIVKEYAKKDSRVRLIERESNGGISAATNDAIAAASHEWLVFMDHDDTLVEHALFQVALAIEEHPNVALLYSDEDKINEANEPFMPYFKSDFDPLLLLGQNYVCHLTTVRRDLVNDLGRLRSEFDGAQDWDLVLRASEVVDRSQIVHIPHVLYHWRSHSESTSQSGDAKPWALHAGRRAVVDALARRGVNAEVREVEQTGFAQVVYGLPDTPPLVTIMIPTRDGRYLGDCLHSVLEKTTYPHFEVLVIDNGSEKPLTKALFDIMGDKIKVRRDDIPFNYSALHNRALEDCAGEVLVMLNDDTTITDGEWLTHLVAQLLQPGVGAVGARLLYPDGRIQHAGVVLGPNGLAGHVGQFHDARDKGYFGRIALASEFQAVTAACLAVRRDTFEKVGGLDETLKVAFNDIDFCLKIQATGLKVTYTPLATLIHHESVSRGSDQHGEKYQRFIGELVTVRDRWGFEIARDPYYNPNLSFHHGLFHLAYPPRVTPWYTGIE